MIRRRRRDESNDALRQHGQPATLVGGYCVEATPVPISNTAVKLHRADGTAGAARWESTSPPAIYIEPPLVISDEGRFSLSYRPARSALVCRVVWMQG